MNTAEQPRPPRRKRWRVVRWMLAALLITGAWFAWRVYDHRQAVKEAESLGWSWKEDSLYTKVEKDWRAIFRRESWGQPSRHLVGPDLDGSGRHSRLLQRLRPTHLMVYGESSLTDLNWLPDLPSARVLYLTSPPNLTDLSGLERLPNLEELALRDYTELHSLDTLPKLDHLRVLRLATDIRPFNMDGIARLSQLEELQVSFGACKTAIEPLKSLKKLSKIQIHSRWGFDEGHLKELRDLLPNVEITKYFEQDH